jgi:hypothetical protein
MNGLFDLEGVILIAYSNTKIAVLEITSLEKNWLAKTK